MLSTVQGYSPRSAAAKIIIAAGRPGGNNEWHVAFLFINIYLREHGYRLRCRPPPCFSAPDCVRVLDVAHLRIDRYDYIMRFGGPYTGTLTGLCDFFGGVVCTLCYSFYPRLLRRGGWALVFRAYAAMNVAAAAAIASFCILEEQDPLLKSPLDSSDSEDGEECDGETGRMGMQ